MKKGTLSAMLLLLIVFVSAQRESSRWKISNIQLNIFPTGRANTFAVDPTDNKRVFVALETGGLFQSFDAGRTWQHLDNFPCFETRSVVILPANPNIVLVTTANDLKPLNLLSSFLADRQCILSLHFPATTLLPQEVTGSSFLGSCLSLLKCNCIV